MERVQDMNFTNANAMNADWFTMQECVHLESAELRKGKEVRDPLGLVALWIAITLFGWTGIAIVTIPVLLWKLRR